MKNKIQCISAVNALLEAQRCRESGDFLLLERRGVNWHVKVVRENTGRVRGYVTRKGPGCDSIIVKGLPNYLSVEKAKSTAQMLKGSYVVLRRSCVEVRPSGFGGMMHCCSLQHAFVWEDIPKGFLCPITKQMMANPVLASCGHTFEKEAIVERKKKEGNCPICEKELTEETISNFRLKSEIDCWQEAQKKAVLPLRFKGNPAKCHEEKIKRANAWIENANIFIEDGDFKTAIGYYEEALAYIDEQKFYAKYVDLLRKERSSKLINACLLLARLYKDEAKKQQERSDEMHLKAEKTYRNALRWMTNEFEIERVNYREELADYLKEIGKQEEAIEQYEMLLQENRHKGTPLIDKCYEILIELKSVPGKYHGDYLHFLIESNRLEKAKEVQRKVQEFWAQKFANLEKKQAEESARAENEIREKNKEKKSLVVVKSKVKKEMKIIQESTKALNLSSCNPHKISEVLQIIDKLSWWNILGCIEKECTEVASKKKIEIKKLDISGLDIAALTLEKLIKNNFGVEKLILANNKKLTKSSLAAIFKWGPWLRYIDFEGCDKLTDETVEEMSGMAFREGWLKGAVLKVVLPSGDKRKFSVNRGSAIEGMRTLDNTFIAIQADPTSLIKLGMMLLELGKHRKAIEYYLNALAIKGLRDQSEVLYKQILESVKMGSEEISVEVADTMEKISGIFYCLEEDKKGQKLQNKVFEIREECYPAAHPELEKTLKLLTPLSLPERLELLGSSVRACQKTTFTNPDTPGVSIPAEQHSGEKVISEQAFNAMHKRESMENTLDFPQLFEDINVTGDGACLFRAISLGFELHTNEELSFQELRDRAVRYLDENREEYAELVRAQMAQLFAANRERYEENKDTDNVFIGVCGKFRERLVAILVTEDHAEEERYLLSDECINEYLENMLNPTAWGGDIELNVIARILNIKLVIYKKESLYQPFQIIGDGDRHLALLFENGHYYLRIPKN